MNTRVMAYLHIASFYDFPVHKVTELLGIQPTETRVKGELGENQFPHRYTSWKYSSGYQETLEVDKVLMEVLEPFENKVQEILAVKEKYQVDTVIQLVIEIYDGRTPGLVIDPRVSKFGGDIGANIDIDLYAFPYVESDEPEIIEGYFEK